MEMIQACHHSENDDLDDRMHCPVEAMVKETKIAICRADCVAEVNGAFIEASS